MHRSVICSFKGVSCLAVTLLVVSGHLFATEIPLLLEEHQGYERRSEVVTVGLPLLRGAVTDISQLGVNNPQGLPVPAQFETLSTWPDKSAKWVLVSFSASCPARGRTEYGLRLAGGEGSPNSLLELSKEERSIVINTGILRCVLNTESFDLFESVQLDHNKDADFSNNEQILASTQNPSIALTGEGDAQVSSRWGQVESVEVENQGSVKATIAVKGSLADRDGEAARLHYTLRLHFYAGSGLVKAFFTLENLEPYEPLTGNHWVLGRPGSSFFEDMSLLTKLSFDGPIQLSVGDGPQDILDRVVLTRRAGIYQDSSGGENWFHRVHMDHQGNIPLRFQGARAFLGEVEPYSRKRPDAWLHVTDRQFGLAVAVRHFWQNFPKALTAQPDGSVRVALWPEEFSTLHELQGGEIKTHEIGFFFHTGPQNSTRSENRVATVMGAFHHPLYVRAPVETYLEAGFFDDATAFDPQAFPSYERIQQAGVAPTGGNLTEDIETTDEYGWRNYGDTWAKNETDKSGSPHTGRQVVNHYNLEYDLGFGMLFQSLRTLGTEHSREWWRLAESALRHESDIDLYHSRVAKGAQEVYSGGKFTHTEHGVEAATAGHRGAPRMTWFGSLRWPWGAGSAPESGHFNNRGMFAYYYLTGDRRVLESALELTSLVYRKITTDNFAQIDRVNRNSGNNLQILTDAYLLTWDEKYREAAEKILESTAPEKQWYLDPAQRDRTPNREVTGFWQHSICINAVARWTAVMEEKTGKPYSVGRDYVIRYADFVSRFLAGGPEVGFFMTWSKSGGGRGSLTSWTYRIADVVMFGHKYSDDPELKQRCLQAAADAFAYMEGRLPKEGSAFVNGKTTTQAIGGGHEFVFFKQNGGWD